MKRGKRGAYKKKEKHKVMLHKYYQKVIKEENGKRDLRNDLVG